MKTFMDIRTWKDVNALKRNKDAYIVWLTWVITQIRRGNAAQLPLTPSVKMELLKSLRSLS